MLERNGVLTALSHRVLAARLFVTEQLIACNGAHSLLARCARWLLTTRDRVDRNQFGLTHECYAVTRDAAEAPFRASA